MSLSVKTHAAPPEPLLRLLDAHAPHSLPLRRRLAFTKFPGGITGTSCILYAARTADGELTNDTPPTTAFAAAYLDFSRGPETEMWLYSSLERGPAEVTNPAALAPDDDAAAECAVALLREVKRLRDSYAAPREYPTVLIGTFGEALRRALVNKGMVFPYAEVYDKWMFQLDSLPSSGGSELEDGMKWSTVKADDIDFLLSRSSIPRRKRTVILLPSVTIELKESNRPVAWCFLGPDSSLSGLHVEEEFRGKGLAKAVAVKCLQEHVNKYNHDGFCWADVAPNNTSSQGVCRSLGGKVAWSVSWSRIDLDRSFKAV